MKTAIQEKSKDVEENSTVALSLLTPDEEALVAQVMAGHVYAGTLERFLLFIQGRRDVVDTIMNKEKRLV